MKNNDVQNCLLNELFGQIQIMEIQFNIFVVIEDDSTQLAISVCKQQSVLMLKAKLEEILKVGIVFMDDMPE